MLIDGVPQRTIRRTEDGCAVEIIDQTDLPGTFTITRLDTVEDVAGAIRTMQVRGAPLIGITAAYGVCLALRERNDDRSLESALDLLASTRPTGRNLFLMLDVMRSELEEVPPGARLSKAWETATCLAEEDVGACARIGRTGIDLIRQVHERNDGRTVNVLTHCNAGWLACVDWGTALAPVYAAHDEGISVHVWVGETRPRNQGAALTVWELGAHGVPHTLSVDSAAGYLMQRGKVDLCIVGADRVLADGTVCNKIGTYPKALAAHDNGIPFYVAFPSTTIDWEEGKGADSIPIEERGADEVITVTGVNEAGAAVAVAIAPPLTSIANPAFDVTPARLVTALITEYGLAEASPEGMEGLFPGRKRR